MINYIQSIATLIIKRILRDAVTVRDLAISVAWNLFIEIWVRDIPDDKGNTHTWTWKQSGVAMRPLTEGKICFTSLTSITFIIASTRCFKKKRNKETKLFLKILAAFPSRIFNYLLFAKSGLDFFNVILNNFFFYTQSDTENNIDL